MVAFGAKLLDNKVSEWSEHYIDYEKLKDILSKMSLSFDKLEELRLKKPELVEAIVQHGEALVVTPSPSQLNFLQTNPHGSNASLTNIREDQTASTGNVTYGSMDAPSETTTSEASLLIRAISRAASGVSDYFYRSFEKSVLETLRAIDAAEEEFDVLLQRNLTRVNTFYSQKVEELNDRISFLKESAAQLHKQLPSAEGQNTPDIAESPLIEPKSHKTSARDTFLSRLKLPGSKQPAKEELDSQRALLETLNDDNDAKSMPKSNVREAESIQRAMEDHYRSAKLLHNYVVMNYTGFVKIIKKFDKTLKQKKGKYKVAIKKENICGDGQEIVALASRMEVLYANWFCDRNINAARAQMLTKHGDGLEMDWSQLQLGYRMGMCSILGLWVCWDCIWGLLSEGMSTIGGRTAFPVFRACGGLVMLEWCWGFSVWVWNRYRVNYIFLFDFDPSTVEGPLVLFNHAVNDTLVYLVCTLLYYKAGAHDIPGNLPPGVFPVMLVLYGTVQLVFPWRRRGPMWSAIWSVITAPSSSPSFFHGYVGDIFTSLVKVFQDLAWTACFVVSGDWMISEDLKAAGKHSWSGAEWYSGFLIPILTLLPLVFRFNQCLRRYADTGKRFPHIANACKYAMSQTVTLFGAFHPLYLRNRHDSDIFQAFWTFAFVGSSLYSFWWDVFQDFGLGQRQYGLLAPRLMYPSRSFYFVIISIDLVLRFAWVLTLLPPKSGAKFALPAYLSLVSMLFEIFRRTLWGFLRLENEHRTNTAGYRRVGFVPLHFSTGHNHSYAKQAEARRGSTVLVEITIITLAVAAAGIVSVVAAQHATQKMDQKEL